MNKSKNKIELINPNVKKTYYKDKDIFQKHLFEQYKLYVEMADRISQRRLHTNTFFLSLNTILIYISGLLLNEKLSLPFNKYLIIIPFLGILSTCYAWWRLVKSYRQLNSAKYKVVGEFEKHLPSSPYYTAEWQELGEGKDPSKYIPLTGIENYLPIIFAIFYTFIGITIILFL